MGRIFWYTIECQDVQPHRQGVENGEHTLEVPPPYMEDVSKAVSLLANNKSAGLDNLPTELFKYRRQALLRHFHKLSMKILQENILPDEWNKDIIVPYIKVRATGV